MRRANASRFSCRRFVAAVCFGALAASAGGCILFSNFDGLEGGSGGGAPGMDGGDASTDADGEAICTTATSDVCNSIAQAPSGFHQTIDGDPIEFCQVPFTTFTQLKGEYRNPCPPSESGIEGAVTAEIRAVWSGIGLHLHVSVRKKTPLGFDPDGAVYHSDAIEVFLANVEQPTNDIAADNVVHQILGPASIDGGPIGASGQLLAEDYIVVPRPGGYDVELVIPWAFVGGHAPAAHRTIAFNLVVDTGDGVQSLLVGALVPARQRRHVILQSRRRGAGRGQRRGVVHQRPRTGARRSLRSRSDPHLGT